MANPGKPALPVNDQMREQVRLMAAAGFTHDEIATTIRNPATGKAITRRTLMRLFRWELEGGRHQANADVVAALFNTARAGNVAAMKLWLVNTRGWRGEPLALTDKPDDEKVVVVIDHEDVPDPCPPPRSSS